MVLARLVGLAGGSATFAQVLLSLPMTLDLLGMYGHRCLDSRLMLRGSI